MKRIYIYLILFFCTVAEVAYSQCNYTLTIVGNAQVVKGQTVTYTYTGSTKYGIWTNAADPNYQPVSTLSYTYTWNQVGTFKLSVLVSNKLLTPSCGEVMVTVVDPCPSVPVLTPAPAVLSGCPATLSVQNPIAGISYKWYTLNTDLTTYTLVNTGNTYTIGSASTKTYYVSAYNQASTMGCLESSKTPITLSPTAIEMPILNEGAMSAFIGSNVLMTVLNPQSGVTYAWWRDNVQVSTGASYTHIGSTAVVQNYQVRAFGDCGNGQANVLVKSATVNIYDLPVIQANRPIENGILTAAGTGNNLLFLNGSYPSYAWYFNGVLVSNSSTYNATKSGQYTVTVTITNNGRPISKTSPAITLQRGTEGLDMNYIISRNILKEGVKLEADIDNLQINELQEQIVYFDGLGRDIQSVVTQGSPTGKDIIVPKLYDAFGREPKSYLPYTGGNTGRYQTDALTKQGQFYNQDNLPAGSTDGWKVGADMPQTLYPYVERVFENSPLNTVLEQGAAGKTWQLAGGKTVKSNTRALRTEDGAVFEWKIGYEANAVPAKGISYVYDATLGSPLWVSEVTDEHGNKALEYKNAQGQTILKKVQSSATEYTQTYYVYDDFGNLRYVMPPLAVERLAGNGYTFTEEIQNLCFRYVYDGRKRLATKQVPSSGEVKIVYDLLDRPILTQDAKQANVPAGAASEWTLTKYDQLGRPVLTALYKTAKTQETLQTEASNYTGSYEQRSTDATYQYYTANLSYPALATNETNVRLLSATYYDDYVWQPNAPVYNTTLGNELNAGVTPLARVQGQTTATVVRKLEQDVWNAPVLGDFITTVSFYDARYRLLQTQTGNHLGGQDILCNQYDFAGKVLKTLQSHQITGQPAVLVRSRTTYDHAGRPLVVYHQTNNQPETTLSVMRYNELGTLVEKKLGQKQGTNVPLQTVNYRQNIRGWMTHINDASLSTQGTDDDRFGFELTYDNHAQGQYNGNISSQKWKSALDGIQRGYAYSYDALNRLTKADYFSDKVGENYSLGGLGANGTMQYDANGNILSLKRYGVTGGTPTSPTFGMIDALSYSYMGNQLKQVREDATATQGNDFVSKSADAQAYYYDANGSLTQDKNKEILSIRYNHLNLPTQIEFTNQRSLYFVYDAAGIKLRKEAYENGLPKNKTDYVGGFIYEQDALSFFDHPEGRVVLENGQYAYEYHYKDHLGNLRMSIKEGKTNTYTAGMETVNQATERTDFANVDITRDGTTAKAGSQSSKLNAAAGKPLGVWKSLPVSKGDKISASTYGFYLQNVESNNSFAFNLAQFLAGSLAVNYGNTVVNGETVTRPFDPQTLLVGLAFVPQNTHNNTSVKLPNAYLRIVEYNEAGTIVNDRIQHISTLSQNNWSNQLNLAYTAQGNGRVEVFVANESDKDVWFDEISITHEQNLICQENHYDPWGLNLVGIEKAGKPDNKFQYNGKEKQTDFALNWSDYHARHMDAQLGRMHSTDALSDNFRDVTPYNYALNNPSNVIDPDGNSAELIIDRDKNGEITGVRFKSHFVFYGSKASKELGQKAINEIKSVWEENAPTITIDGKTSKVQIDVSFEVVDTEKAKESFLANESAANNYIAIENKEITNSKASFMLNNGNTGVFLEEDILSNNRTIAHEYGHGLGWNDPKQYSMANGISEEGGKASTGGLHDLYGTSHGVKDKRYVRPSIMVAQMTPADAPRKYLGLPKVFAPEYTQGGFIIPSSRIVTNFDMKLININASRSSVGGLSDKKMGFFNYGK